MIKPLIPTTGIYRKQRNLNSKFPSQVPNAVVTILKSRTRKWHPKLVESKSVSSWPPASYSDGRSGSPLLPFKLSSSSYRATDGMDGWVWERWARSIITHYMLRGRRWDERGPPFMTSSLKGEGILLLPQNQNTAKIRMYGMKAVLWSKMPIFNRSYHSLIVLPTLRLPHSF